MLACVLHVFPLLKLITDPPSLEMIMLFELLGLIHKL